ncbi:Flp family type IVb pilin [Pseudaminobacter arsenicus]|uniref:Flp family type IVb pilin n=1 Tax=Borborobacter arsenicus TaxID=1851146 RepID=A0A432V6F9_9HYPH|nr:Flp family type IVb pilin [Pseudaminobacter arsenicus]RUM97766.1 Flp family type IVb pilin [Pseudaminobacter arsenicus]
MQKRIRQFASDESGATAIEYGLVAALISMAIVVGVGQFAESLEFLFSDNGSQIVQALGD